MNYHFIFDILFFDILTIWLLKRTLLFYPATLQWCWRCEFWRCRRSEGGTPCGSGWCRRLRKNIWNWKKTKKSFSFVTFIWFFCSHCSSQHFLSLLSKPELNIIDSKELKQPENQWTASFLSVLNREFRPSHFTNFR